MLKNEKDHEEEDEAVSLTKEFNNTNKKKILHISFAFLKLKKAKFVFKAGLLYHHLSPKISTKMY